MMMTISLLVKYLYYDQIRVLTELNTVRSHYTWRTNDRFETTRLKRMRPRPRPITLRLRPKSGLKT